MPAVSLINEQNVKTWNTLTSVHPSKQKNTGIQISLTKLSTSFSLQHHLWFGWKNSSIHRVSPLDWACFNHVTAVIRSPKLTATKQYSWLYRLRHGTFPCSVAVLCSVFQNKTPGFTAQLIGNIIDKFKRLYNIAVPVCHALLSLIIVLVRAAVKHLCTVSPWCQTDLCQSWRLFSDPVQCHKLTSY